jgi:putative alpha-1,2-mannosidase
VPRIYPCLDSVVAKGVKEDWRSTVTGNPSLLNVKYQTNQPPGASTMAITVSPHVSVFKVTFPEGSRDKYLVFDFSRGTVDNWAVLNRWTNRKVTRIDSRTLQATIGAPGASNVFYLIKFSAPCAGSGTIDASGAITEGASEVAGASLGMYARFDAPTVTVAVAESFTGMDKAKEFLAAEFTQQGVPVEKRGWNLGSDQ